MASLQEICVFQVPRSTTRKGRNIPTKSPKVTVKINKLFELRHEALELDSIMKGNSDLKQMREGSQCLQKLSLGRIADDLRS